jgi:N-acetylmuramic acid 6-phosphate etherase
LTPEDDNQSMAHQSNTLAKLTTEGRNPASMALDTLTTVAIIELINSADRTVADCVARAIPQIAQAVDLIVAAFENGGRLFYVGAGTSGRLGVLDASEAPPTFGVDSELIQAVIAGGREAVFQAAENCEDRPEQGAADLENRQVNCHDVVVGIAASGRTPYVCGALQLARRNGAKTIALVCNRDAELTQWSDLSITVVVGPEVLSGSTRMKAGTAQKMVLNMLSTAAMVRMGKVYQNLMVDLRPTNRKLVERAINIITAVTGADRTAARELLQKSGYNVKTAIVMAEGKLSQGEATALLDSCRGRVREAISAARKFRDGS